MVPLRIVPLLLVVVMVPAALTDGSRAEADEEADPGNIADWFSRLQDLDMKGEESIASMLVSMAALQALSTSMGQKEDIISLLAQTAKESMHDLGRKLSDSLGSPYASVQKEVHGPGQLQINLAGLLELTTEDLDARLAAAAEALGASMSHTADTSAAAGNPSTAATDNSNRNITEQQGARSGSTRSTAKDDHKQQEAAAAAAAAANNNKSNSSMAGTMPEAGIDLQSLLNGLNLLDNTDMEVELATTAAAGEIHEEEPLDLSATQQRQRHLQAVTSVQTTDKVLRNGTITIISRNPFQKYPVMGTIVDAKRNRSVQRRKEVGKFVNALLGVDWEKLQQRVQEKLTNRADNKLNRIPRIKAYNKLEQIFQIVVDRLTGGQGLGEGCTPYVFSGGGARLPETIIFPSFSISQTTGNCVLIPEFIGNAEYPGQWSLANSRVACLGPSSEYLLVPAFKRSAATSSEAFACPTCRNEFSIGPAATITLAGDASQVIKFKNKAEFLAAVKTNKTFGWGRGGLDAALQRLRSKLKEKQDILSKYTRGSTADGKLSSLLGWLNNAWRMWQPTHARAQSTAKGKARTLLEDLLTEPSDQTHHSDEQDEQQDFSDAAGMPERVMAEWDAGLEQAMQELHGLLTGMHTTDRQA